MEYIRTPKKYFENLKDYPFKPNYLSIDGFQMHYVHEGDRSSPIILLLHGEPTWSYLYRKIIPRLKDAGFQVIAPDLVGFGKSDKPVSSSVFTFSNHIKWLESFINKLDLNEITVFFQDWGSLIGLRVLTKNTHRFARVILSNGGLPIGNEKIPKAFRYWRNFAKYSPWFPIGRIVNFGCVSTLDQETVDAYNAPFPKSKYKVGARIFPKLVPIDMSNVEAKNNLDAWEILKKWNKPFMTAFSNRDPITRGAAKKFQALIPGCQDCEHKIIRNAGHFLQEDKSEELSQLIINFTRNN